MYVHERFRELEAILEAHGWQVAASLSEWDEGKRHDPVMGLVRIRGYRESPDGTHVSFSAKEWWAHPPAKGPLERHGFFLAGYHYMGISATGYVRYCYDTIRHPDTPFHRHPPEKDPVAAEPIDVETALDILELQLATELLESEGLTAADLEDDEDTVDEVFGELD
jgi:hypothetical protein